MAKITRYNGNLQSFAEGATGTERTIFGDTAQSDDLTLNITADFLRGWGIVGVNETPSKQDFNAGFFVLSRLLAYLHQVGIPEWNVAQEYNTDSITSYLGIIYVSDGDANIGNEPGVDAGWTNPLSSYASLAGSASQVFSVGTAWAAAHAVRLDQTCVAQDFRLTLTSGAPVTTADVTGATTVYATPKTGNKIGLYSGSVWVNYASAEFSLALGTLTSDKPYDVFAYANAGVPTLEFLVWTNDTTRATALAYQDGILVKSGDATRRYLGTFYTTSTTQTEDSDAKRYLWNYYHRVARRMRRIETTASWVYTSATWRQANASALNQLNFIIGVAEDAVGVTLTAHRANSTSPVGIRAGTALDSTTVPSRNTFFASTGVNHIGAIVSGDTYLPAAGRHYIAWLELSEASGTTTWYGSAYESGIVGHTKG